MICWIEVGMVLEIDRLTEIGVAGVQQACQAWRASRGVTRSFILILVYDHRISVFKLLDVHVMFVDETFNVDTFCYRCLDVEKPCCRSLILGIFPSRLHQPNQNLVCHSQISYCHLNKISCNRTSLEDILNIEQNTYPIECQRLFTYLILISNLLFTHLHKQEPSGMQFCLI